MQNRPVHGGAVWSIVGGDVKNLKNFVAADVADAWYPPSPEVLEGLCGALNYIQWAPDTWGDGLRDYIATHFQMPTASIMVDAGSSPLIDRALSTLLRRGDNMILVSPTYSEYESVAVRCGANIRWVNLSYEEGFRCNVDRLLSKVDGKTRAVVLCNPNNPTGLPLSKDDLFRLAHSLPEPVALIVDEVYTDYTPECSVLVDVIENPYLCVIRSFSKSHALAGLRVGFGGVGDEVGRAMRKAGEVPWRISLLADVGARLALSHQDYVRERIAETVKLREDLRNSIAEIEGCEPLPSKTNFFLVRIADSGLTALEWTRRLRAEGVLIKAVTPWLGGADSGFIRITTRSSSDNRRTIAALEKVARQ